MDDELELSVDDADEELDVELEDELDDEPEVEEEPEPVAAAIPVDPEVAPRGDNQYVVAQGDHPYKVAKELYGQGSLGRDLVKRNPGATWKPGTVIDLL